MSIDICSAFIPDKKSRLAYDIIRCDGSICQIKKKRHRYMDDGRGQYPNDEIISYVYFSLIENDGS